MTKMLVIARSLIILSFFVLPLLIYIFRSRLNRPETKFGASSASAILIALISSAAVIGIVSFSSHWPESTQVVWTGIESDPTDLVIGSPRERAVVGWPNGSFTPSMRVASIKDRTLTLELADGGAFVWDEDRKTFWGGTSLDLDAEKTIDGYRVRLVSNLQANLSAPLPTTVEILDQQGTLLAGFKLPVTNPNRNTILSLRSLVEANGATSPVDAERIVTIGKWSANKRLLLSRQGEARIIGVEQYPVQCQMPCNLTLYWTGQKLSFRIDGSTAQVRVMFLPPWRSTSPLPPLNTSGERKFVVTSSPKPGDVTLVVPFGHGTPDRRPTLTFGKDPEGRPVFSGNDVILGAEPLPTYLPPGSKPLAKSTDFAANVTSQTSVLFDRTSFHFATVNDLPRPKGIVLLLALALVTYAIGLLLLGVRSPDSTTRRVIYGLSAVLWNLLLFRLLLALRFALDPSHLDDLTVKGVTLAFAALSVLPGLFLLWARLRADLNARMWAFEKNADAEEREAGRPENKPGYVKSLVFLVVLAIVFVLQFWLTPYLWSNSSASRPLRLAWPFMLLALYLALVIICVYLSYLPRLRRILRLVFLDPLRLDTIIVSRGKMIWSQLANEPPQRHLPAIYLWALALVAVLAIVLAASLQPATRWVGKIGTVALLLVAIFAIVGLMHTLIHRASGRLISASLVFLVLPFLTRAVPGSVREIIQEVLALFVLCLVPALLWLTVSLVSGARTSQVSWRRLVFLSCTGVLLPVFVMPKFLGDVGSAFATIPVFLALSAFLLFTTGWRAGVAVFCMLFAGIFLAGFTYRYFSPWLPGAAEVRLVTYWQGSEVERLIPWARATKGGEGLSLQSLRDAYQHGWESRSIAYEGSWLGLGFGNAPTHLSQVRQDTIQFDSLFSFFIAGEHGFVGGISLLLLFALPLLLIWQGGKQTKFDFGYTGAMILMSWLFLEAILHAGMNLGTFPFTGRGMPVINVNSTSDVLRWLLLFSFAAQLLQWRDPDGDVERDKQDIKPLIRPANTLPASTPKDGEPRKKFSLRLLPSFRIRPFATVLVAALPLIIVAVSHVRLITDKDFPRTFEWAGVLNRVRSMIRDQVLTVDQQKATIVVDWNKLPGDFNVPDGALLKQEILRFNALTVPERLDEQTTSDYRSRLGGVGNVSDYDRLLNDLRIESIGRQRDLRASLFRLLPPERQTDGVTVREVGGYRLAANSAFNSRFSFRAGRTENEISRVSFSDGQVLIGPAWVGGHWITAFNPDHSIPWTLLLARTLSVEQNCFGRDEKSGCQATLTIDRPLQEAVTRFISVKGRRLYDEILNAGRPGSQTLLPPRVGVTILNLPAGETLVLGGYPRMTSSPYWQRAVGSGEWLPPVRWVEQQAPDAIRTLYGGDRNFDRVVVGSATKPIWAAAVLQVHPRLNEQLRVTGREANESQVFGIPISDGWHVTPRENWVDFTQYLALSDNRYHVRLGFLGLAEDVGADVRGAGASPSNSESLTTGAAAVWKRFPVFSPQLRFSARTPNELAGLSDTALSNHLERMFAINTGQTSLAARVSFWTKNAEDDLSSATNVQSTRATDEQGAASTAGFVAISPVAPNLHLDGVTAPRDYVSILLGGRTNLWSNVDLASAFITSILGTPVSPHIIADSRPFEAAAFRENFPETAQKLRPALAAVVSNGTFRSALLDRNHDAALGTRALAILNDLSRSHSIYAKTGTLQTATVDQHGTPRYTSRVVLALVRWNGPRQDSIRSGLVFSLYAEMSEEGTASRWLGQFLVENEQEIRRVLERR